ncbi:B-cell receptor CD22-like isoform X2 [Synchiropus splendidus]|uniref:B-cell receptor CD22-like isoform X2 n=1 Tax=Synchiropus splendidus TaxID=270530 RepID=UPI00237EE344|nr:B-cell receptor CD22-like isoform X2 [Synchiropus splendidus]
MTIADVTEEDSNDYLFKVVTSEDSYIIASGVSLTVTGLAVVFTAGGLQLLPIFHTLMCHSSCFTSHDSYVWYKNGIKLAGQTKQGYSGIFRNGNSYSCAVKGHEDLPTRPVCFEHHCTILTYSGSRRVCAPAGSSVMLSCSYSYTGALSSQFWFSPQQSQHWRLSEPEDISEVPRYTSEVLGPGMISRVSTLTISDLRESDSAEFLFKFTSADFEWKSTLPGISLTVTALQVQLWSVPQTSSSGSIRVQLMCRSSCSSPGRQSYIWFKNEDKVPENKLVYEVTLRPGDHVRCGLEGHDGHISAPLYNPSGPSVVQSPPGEVVEGRTVNLTCSFGPGRGSNYTWNKKSTLTQQRFVGRDLLFRPVRPSDSGEFSCSVNSVFGRRMSPSVVIDVHYGPRPPSVRVTSDEVMEGASVNLTCSSDANPPVNYTWYLEGDTTAVAFGETFTITNVRREQAGSFLCRAQNLIGQSEAAVHLGVSGLKKTPFASITGIILLPLLLAGSFLIRMKLSRPSPEPAVRAKYHVQRCDDSAAVEQEESVGLSEQPVESLGLQCDSMKSEFPS